jgi:hypothetical protein
MLLVNKKGINRELVRAARQLFLKDKELVVLPLLGVVALLGTFAAVFKIIHNVPFLFAHDAPFFFAHSTSFFFSFLNMQHVSLWGWIVSAVIAYISTALAVFFRVALVAGASERMEGGGPSIRTCIRAAARRLSAILSWSLISATVVIVLRMFSNRVPLFGSLAVILIGGAWTMSTFFMIPMIVAGNPNSFGSIRESKNVFVSRWKNVVNTSLIVFAYTIAASLLPTLVLLGGVFSWNLQSSHILGGLLICVGVVVLGALMLVSSVAFSYVRTALYRYLNDRPIKGNSVDLLNTAFPQTS